MHKALSVITAALIAAQVGGIPVSAVAGDRATLGWGHLFTNDFIGDGKDRWRTGAYTLSVVQGRGWDGLAPARFGEILEYRARAEIIAPDNLTRQEPGDRRYAGTMTFGVHSHFSVGLAEARLGADLAITGPQTGLDDFQDNSHDLLGLSNPGVFSTQIGNGFHPTVSGEIGRNVALTQGMRLRPFAEAQAGIETFVRVGGDLVIGEFGRDALMLRDTTTGQRYSGIILGRPEGISLVLGADITQMGDSEYLSNAQMKDTRKRLRGGVHWRGPWGEVFYGATWLSEEFAGQPNDQIVGSLRIDLRF